MSHHPNKNDWMLFGLFGLWWLAAAEEDTFSIEKSFDFYCKWSLLFIANKRAFEAVLKHQVAYYEKFEILKNDQTFCSLFRLIDLVNKNINSPIVLTLFQGSSSLTSCSSSSKVRNMLAST